MLPVAKEKEVFCHVRNLTCDNDYKKDDFRMHFLDGLIQSESWSIDILLGQNKGYNWRG